MGTSNSEFAFGAVSFGAATPKLSASTAQRTVAAQDTVARMKRHFAPLGITRVANVTGLDCVGIPSVTVCRPNSRSLSLSQGKGVSLEAAMASGVMEAIELWHAERVHLPLRLCSWDELRFNEHVVDVERLPRVALNRFTPRTPLLWVQGLELNSGELCWLPFELVHMDLRVPFPTGSGCFVMSSNGLASGNHPLEAIVHGLCEVVERDAATSFLGLDEPAQEARRVDLATVEDSTCRDLLGRYERAGVTVAAWDITSEIGIAAYRCVIVDRECNTFRPLPPLEGMGCHLVREAALARALTEAAQARLTFITGSRDDNLPDRYDQSLAKDLSDAARRRLLSAGTRQFTRTPSHEFETLEEDMDFIVRALRAAHLQEIVIVDLTKPGLDVPVVRVVVPGLEPYHGVDGGRAGPRARAAMQRERTQA